MFDDDDDDDEHDANHSHPSEACEELLFRCYEILLLNIPVTYSP